MSEAACLTDSKSNVLPLPPWLGANSQEIHLGIGAAQYLRGGIMGLRASCLHVTSVNELIVSVHIVKLPLPVLQGWLHLCPLRYQAVGLYLS